MMSNEVSEANRDRASLSLPLESQWHWLGGHRRGLEG
jgi:hypothetical protein